MMRGVLAVVIALVLSAMPVHAGAQATALMDVSKITDAKAKAAVEKINELQAGIKELQIDEMTEILTMTVNTSTTTITKSIVRERRPDLFFKRDSIMVGPLETGKKGVLFDGKNIWQMTLTSKPVIDRIEQSMKKRNMPQAEIDKTLAEMRAVKVDRWDVEKLKAAGVYDDVASEFNKWLEPLKLIAPATLKVDRETPEAWVFTSISKTESVPTTLTFNKADGVCVRIESRPKTFQLSITIDKYTVNPTPPIENSVFVYKPSATASVREATDISIKQKKNFKD